MKAMKRMAAILLAVCMLVGLPISVSRAEDTPLTMTKAELLVESGTNVGKRVKVTFSEEVCLPEIANLTFHVNLVQVNSKGETTDNAHGLSWDLTNEAIYYLTKNPNTSSSVDIEKKWGTMIKGASVEYANVNGVEDKTGLVFTLASVTFHRMVAAYQAALDQGWDCRWVARFKEDQQSDGSIQGICALNNKTKYLQTNNTTIGYDWAGIDVSILHVTKAMVYADDRLAITFNKSLSAATLGENTTWTLGWAKKQTTDAKFTTGIIDTTKSHWTFDNDDIRYSKDDHTLLISLANGAYKSITTSAPEGYSLAVTATETGTVDGVISDIQSENGICLNVTKKPGGNDKYYYDYVDTSEATSYEVGIGDAPLTVVKAELDMATTNINKGVKVYFSEPVNVPVLNQIKAHIVLQKVSNGITQNTTYYYSSFNSGLTEYVNLGEKSVAGTTQYNTMMNLGEVDVTSIEVEGAESGSVLIFTLKNDLLYRMVAMYEQAIATYGEDACRLIVRFKEEATSEVPGITDVNINDGYINGITAKAKNSDGSVKYLSKNHPAVKFDWTEIPVSILRVTEAKVYSNDKLAITFNEPLSEATLGNNISWKLGYAPNTGVIDTSKANWDIPSTDVSFYSDNQTLLVSLPDGAYDTITSTTPEDGYTLSITATESNGTQNGAIDGLVSTNQLQLNTKKRSSIVKYDYYYFEGVVTSAETIKEAAIGETTYDSFVAALADVKDGETVALLQNVAADMVKVPSGTTLDLNGKNLTTDIFIGFGYVVDGASGLGKLKISQNGTEALLHLQQNNPDLPLWDTDGYRFFTYELVAKGYQVVSEGETNRYGVSLIFDDVEAYEFLAESADTCGVKLVMDMTHNGNDLGYKFKSSTLKAYAEACAAVMKGEVEDRTPDQYVKKTIVLTVTGLNNGSLTVDSILKTENTPVKSVEAVNTLYSAN